MLWPWVTRTRYLIVGAEADAMRVRAQTARESLKRLRQRYKEAIGRATAAEAAADVLRHELERCHAERVDAQLRLTRVGFGINPFPELQEPNVMPQQAAPEAPAPGQFTPGPYASAEEVQALFTREALELHGGNIRAVTRHVEQRQAEYYGSRRQSVPSPVSAEEMAQAQAVAADLNAAIAEGRARAVFA